ncbi:MAG TPA: redox-regulated ATPase YchF [Thermodesulfobium narugense]|uniref:TGS domain-containing protein n=1 Tax=Thermodesulfobium acidiphilum TaxID=1794699 RepID=A0A2R4VYQ0_THEAF|nr:DUF933 domain-containing protein [Thermodesulfobium acidiphilum]AWB09642.1 hypothetical protein TDSAC_0258 [Thermodesulfobium acidiphilum]PMP86855.1 MAG: redox-regulated ATPase YchF [Thermodesulfobium narugense]HEM55134.1 redox-regulated ATPase YchF [Thermodesulfobium narugense]
MVGITAFPFSGKTTVINLLLKRSSFQKSDNEGRISVPDERLETLARIFEPLKKTPAFIPIKELSAFDLRKRIEPSLINEMKNAEVISFVARSFDISLYPYIYPEIDPKRDIRKFLDELIIEDIAVVEKRIKTSSKGIKKNSQEEKEIEILKKALPILEEGRLFREVELSSDEIKHLKHYSFLTLKPFLLLLNIGESDLVNTGKIEEEFTRFLGRSAKVLALSAKLEEELSMLEPEEAKEMLLSFGLKSFGLERFIQACYDLLGYMTFFTVGKDEVRAWQVRKGASALEAAARIHSDIARGFIRAEVISYEDFISCGAMNEAKKRGLLRLEGKEYLVKDGDILHVRFNI